MYWKLFLESMDGLFSRRNGARLVGLGSLAALLVVVAGLRAAHLTKGQVKPTKLWEAPYAPEREVARFSPGAQEPLVLSRTILSDLAPEFRSVTLLPSRGMDVFQITVNLPGKGEVKLLVPSDHSLSSTGNEPMEELPALDGAFSSPWAGRLGGDLAVDGRSTEILWQGRPYHLPVDTRPGEQPSAADGLLQKMTASDVEVNPMPDGGAASATFTSGDLDGRWPSKTQTRVSVLMASKALELGVVVSNVGSEATPVGIGWIPRFSIPGGQRERTSLRLPASMRVVKGKTNGMLPTGDLEAVKGTPDDFTPPGGAMLGTHGLDDTFTRLGAVFDMHPAMELRNPASGFGVRLTALSPTIKAIHVFSPAGSDFVSISPQMNYDDPFGGEWKMSEDTGMVVLQPGQTVEWKVRVEVFEIPATSPRRS